MFSRRTGWPLSLNRLSQALRQRHGAPLIDLTESNPTRCGFVYESDRILRALSQPPLLRYQPDPRGPAAARDAVASYYRERGACPDPSQIFITSSTSEAYSYVFRLLADAGDLVLAPQPSYPLLDNLAQLDGVAVTPYPLMYNDAWQTDRGVLEERIRPETRAVLLVNPNNPTGSYVSIDDRAFIAGLCGEHNLAMVADEVFLDYRLEPPEASPPPSLAGEGSALSLTLSGLSKISALPQMKLAWIVVNGPAQLRETALQRLEMIADTYLSISAPLGLALLTLLDTRFSIQPQILERTRANLARLDAMLSASSPVSRLRAEAGWSVVLRVPALRSDEDWALMLLEKDDVLVHPGHFYDFSADGYLVVSLLPAPEYFEEGVRRLLARVRSQV